ncbi:MAG: hypothetical protein AAFN63_19025 [Pseudomonadota bacterium]
MKAELEAQEGLRNAHRRETTTIVDEAVAAQFAAFAVVLLLQYSDFLAAF